MYIHILFLLLMSESNTANNKHNYDVNILTINYNMLLPSN